ncbi:hypothetical protein VD659_15190 [Herbiconiux sp. 11R-BC]|uniref:hypothetical protein n=1 Tax=Herbiconiux sp. 11R-BC TaxID=3111637 RepID=UPI003C0CFAD3
MSEARDARAATAGDRDHWIEHRRGDGELVGWMLPEGEGFAVVDLLGRELSGPVDWFAAETLLEERGLRYLAEPFVLEREGAAALRVRITEVSTERIRVKKDDFGAIDAPQREFVLPWPAPTALRPFERDDEPGGPFGL